MTDLVGKVDDLVTIFCMYLHPDDHTHDRSMGLVFVYFFLHEYG